jgi:hypothetical protein
MDYIRDDPNVLTGSWLLELHSNVGSGVRPELVVCLLVKALGVQEVHSGGQIGNPGQLPFVRRLCIGRGALFRRRDSDAS